MDILRATPSSEVCSVKRYHIVDIVLALSTASVAGNPFDIQFAVAFSGPAGHSLTVPGFYDDDMGYVVRFSPTVKGMWGYESQSDVPELSGISGSIQCIPNDNPSIHGPFLVDPHHPHHFVYEDGKPCFLMGYEVNWLMMVDQLSPDLTRVDAFLDSITAAGFNMLTLNTYAYFFRAVPQELEHDPVCATPKLAPWSGGNESPDYSRFDPAFFQHYDRVMVDLLERGLLAHTMIHVYNKQVNWPEFGSPDDNRYWRYFIARYQAFCNIIFDTAKESYNREPEYIWERLGIMRQLDGYRRIITVHDANTSPKNQKRFDPRKSLNDGLCDFKSDQVHSEWYQDALMNYRAAQRPYVNIEYGYEDGVDDRPSHWLDRNIDWLENLRRTWLVTMGGGYPNYYYSHTAWTFFQPFPEPPGYIAHRRYMDFWRTTQYWLLTPDNAPLGDNRPEKVYCRCDPGREYVVFDESAEGFDLMIPEGCGKLKSVWFNPVTGEYAEGGVVGSGISHFVPPWGEGNWGVLHVHI